MNSSNPRNLVPKTRKSSIYLCKNTWFPVAKDAVKVSIKCSHCTEHNVVPATFFMSTIYFIRENELVQQRELISESTA